MGESGALLVERGDEAVGTAAMLRALADSEDRGVTRAHVIIDDDAASYLEAGLLREFDTRADAYSDHHEVRIDALAALEDHALDTCVRASCGRSVKSHSLALKEHPDTEALDCVTQQRTPCCVQLLLHEPGHEVHDRGIHLALGDSARRLKTEESTSDHHGASRAAALRQDCLDIVEGAKYVHTPSARAFHRWDEGLRSGGEDQAVVGCLSAGFIVDHAPRAIDRHGSHARAQLDAALFVPVGVMGDGLAAVALSGEKSGEEDPIVSGVRFLTEHSGTPSRIPLQRGIEAGKASHAVADHDEPSFAHDVPPGVRSERTRTAQCLSSGCRERGSTAS